MEYTLPDIGVFLRKIRIDNNETGVEMSKRLGMSKGYISMIELGKRQMSLKVKNKFIEEYKLDEKQIIELNRIISNDSDYIKITTNKLSKSKKELIANIGDILRKIDKEDENKIKEIVYKYIK